jgi:hypothetical protein
MLSEMLMTGIPDFKMLTLNTDGITSIFDKKYKDDYLNICSSWEVKTKLSLEHADYKKYVLRDCNNYIAQTLNNKVKYKGCFKTHEEMIKDGEYHKAFSQGIVPIALSKYYIDNILPEDTIRNHENIYDFCKTFNATHGWRAETLIIDESGNESDIREEQKNNRYYISKNGRKFRKIKEAKKIDIEANDLVIIFNKYEEKLSFEDYDVDFDYYINECYKIIDTINGEKERRELEKKEMAEKSRIEREESNYLTFVINRAPTQRMYDMYKRDWLVEKYGEPTSIKIIKKKKLTDEETGQLSFAEFLEGVVETKL